MPAYQTAYINNPLSAVVGMIGDAEFTTILSKEIQASVINFGLAVSRGTLAGQTRLGGTIFDGITTLDKANLNAAGMADRAGRAAACGVEWADQSGRRDRVCSSGTEPV